MSAHGLQSLHGNLCYGGLLRGSVVPVKFLLVSLNTLPAEHETSNALVVVWSGERSTLRITEPDTARTKRALVRLIDISSLDSRLYQAKRQMHTMHGSTHLCLVSASVSRTTRYSLSVLTSRNFSQICFIACIDIRVSLLRFPPESVLGGDVVS